MWSTPDTSCARKELKSRTSHSWAPPKNDPQGSRIACPGSRRSQEPPPPTKAARGVRVYCGVPIGEDWRPAVSLVSKRLISGWILISWAKLRWNDEIGNTWVAPKGTTFMFPDFLLFLVTPNSSLPVFKGLNIFRQRMIKITGYAWLILCHILIIIKHKEIKHKNRQHKKIQHEKIQWKIIKHKILQDKIIKHKIIQDKIIQHKRIQHKY